MPPLALTNAFGPKALAEVAEVKDAEPVVAESVETEAEAAKVRSVKSKGAK